MLPKLIVLLLEVISGHSSQSICVIAPIASLCSFLVLMFTRHQLTSRSHLKLHLAHTIHYLSHRLPSVNNTNKYCIRIIFSTRDELSIDCADKLKSAVPVTMIGLFIVKVGSLFIVQLLTPNTVENNISLLCLFYHIRTFFFLPVIKI